MKIRCLHRFEYLLVAAITLPLLSCAKPYEGLWKKWSIDSSGSGADGVHVADINRDGSLDVVSGWEQSGELKVYLNPGPEKVKEEGAWQVLHLNPQQKLKGIEDAAFVDMDLDGHADAIVASIEGRTKSLKLYQSEGEGGELTAQWKAEALAPEGSAGYMKARAGQLDGVGGPEIVAGTKAMKGHEAAVYWFRATGSNVSNDDTVWQRFFVGEIDKKTTTLAIRDMDADDVPDIVYSGRFGFGWFKNPGYEVLAKDVVAEGWENIVISPMASEFTFCNETGDGSENIIAVTSQGSGMVAQWFKRLDSTGRNWQMSPILSDDKRPGKESGKKFALKGVGCGFVDGDNVIDLVFTASGHGYGVFMMSPRTGLQRGEAWNLTHLSGHANNMKYDNLALVDLDNDGDLDITSTEEGGVFSAGEGVLWFENPLY